MEKTIVDIITNSVGAVSVAALFLYFRDRDEKRNTILFQNHLQHSTEAMSQMAIALTKLSIIVDKFSQTTKNYPIRQTKK